MRTNDGKTTGIQVGDIIITNHSEETLQIRRGEELLSFETIKFDKGTGKFLNNKVHSTCYFRYNENMNIYDFLGEILSLTGLTVAKVDPTNPGEECWLVKEYSE